MPIFKKTVPPDEACLFTALAAGREADDWGEGTMAQQCAVPTLRKFHSSYVYARSGIRTKLRKNGVPFPYESDQWPSADQLVETPLGTCHGWDHRRGGLEIVVK